VGVLGRFHEIGISTADIRASVEFYERLGFSHAHTGDSWPHPYGVLTDGRIFLGLHQSSFDSPALTFVHEDIARYARELEAQGLRLAYQHTAEHEFNTIGFKDPTGQMLVLVEARTYSPVLRRPERVSACGYFAEFSMPSADLQAAKDFWENCGFVATEAAELPYPHLPLTSDHLDIAFHARRILDRPMLVFRDHGMRERLGALRELAVGTWRAPPQGLDSETHALLEAPEGTALLFVEEES
jgi:catechol 2,3-dioxygenase-like lactoylglutathione lyase family enzyme